MPQIERPPRLDLIRYVTGLVPDGVHNHNSDFNDERRIADGTITVMCLPKTNPSGLHHVQRCA